ncbi:DUF3397 family protein [Alkalibacterium olivapovliticus]|uniref:DUF3397 family protein n=1 Tax=Alkalibacterium olivapovliticus TaxID=99907 RepID=UPI000D071518
MSAIGSVTIDTSLILFYISPFAVLFFSRRLNAQFKLVSIPIKVVDLLIPYLVILIYAFGRMVLQFNIVPYIIILVSVLGIALVTQQTFVKRSLSVYLFFRLWWRYVFLILMVTHVAVGLIALYQITV